MFPARQLRDQFGWDCRIGPHHKTQMTWRKGEGLVNGGMMRVDLDVRPSTLLGLRPDLVVFQRPVDAGAPEVIRALRAQGVRVIVETDDWMQGLPSWNPAFEKMNVKFSPGRNHAIFAECAVLADALTVSTPFLAERYRRLNRNVHVLRNRLEWSMWENVPPVYEARTWDRLRIGWMGDAKWHGDDLKVLRGTIGPWLERNPDVDFVAQPEALDILEVPAGQRVVMGNVPFRDMELYKVTAIMDIGLVPLKEHPFNEGKSHLKGMEYAACGIPCLASPTESYRWWLEGEATGFLCKRPRDFARRLDQLVAAPALLADMGRAARAKAERSTVAEHAHEWADTYAAILGQEAAA